MPGYPIELDLRDRNVVVVGLGAVGVRKALGLTVAGARVVGVDPAADPARLPTGVDVRAEPYRPAHLHGAALVFAAATSEVNRVVVGDARKAGVWVCSASEPTTGDFLVPAVWREGPVTLTVSTAGASPALAAALRDRAAAALGPAAAGLATLLSELRPEARARCSDRDRRRRVLTDWADLRWLDLWSTAGPEAVRRALRARLEQDESSGVARFEPEGAEPAAGGGADVLEARDDV